MCEELSYKSVDTDINFNDGENIEKSASRAYALRRMQATLLQAKANHNTDAFLYSSADVLSALNGNYNAAAGPETLHQPRPPPCCCCIAAQFSTLTLSAIRDVLQELFPRDLQASLEDGYGDYTFAAARVEEMRILTADPTSTLSDWCRFAVKGVPSSCRLALYCRLLGVPLQRTDNEKRYFESLKSRARASDDPVQRQLENMLQAQTMEVLNDDRYFIFRSLSEVAVALARDLFVGWPDESGTGCARGWIPFEHSAFVIAPLFYVTDCDATRFYLTRAFCKLYVSRMHSLSARPETLLDMAGLFEKLLGAIAPDVASHCVSLHVYPLCIAMPWLMTLFAGQLEPVETLLLWDRIIGGMTLTAVPALAAGILWLRREEVLHCASKEEVTAVFHSLRRVHVGRFCSPYCGVRYFDSPSAFEQGQGWEWVASCGNFLFFLFLTSKEFNNVAKVE